jgi:hypothetical protein
MSSLFFDQLINLDKITKTIKKVSSTKEEEIELWGVVDEIVHHQVLGCILENLPKKHHRQFLDMFNQNPSDEQILVFLQKNTKTNISSAIKRVIDTFCLEIIGGLENDGARN